MSDVPGGTASARETTCGKDRISFHLLNPMAFSEEPGLNSRLAQRVGIRRVRVALCGLPMQPGSLTIMPLEADVRKTSEYWVTQHSDLDARARLMGIAHTLPTPPHRAAISE